MLTVSNNAANTPLLIVGEISIEIYVDKKLIASKGFALTNKWKTYIMTLTPEQYKYFKDWSEPEVVVNCNYQPIVFKELTAKEDTIVFKGKLGEWTKEAPYIKQIDGDDDELEDIAETNEPKLILPLL